MKRLRLKHHYSLALSLLALLWLAPSPADEVSLREYKATYKLYKGGMYLANTEISLLKQPSNRWFWRMNTKARGIYALLTKKEPFAETVFSQEPGEFRIHRITINDGPAKKKSESARFDWDKGHIKVLRKNKTSKIDLVPDIYDLQSLHLLAAKMELQQVKHTTVDFYYKGRLEKTSFVSNGEGSVNVNGESIEALIYEQRVSNSDAKLRYYYDAKYPYLPLRIEKLESGESPAILTLQNVEWTL